MIDGDIQAVLDGKSEGCVVCGDCLEAMQEWPDNLCVVSDPPYGINYIHGEIHIPHATRFAGVPVVGDDRPFDPTPFLRFRRVILWGANHYATRLPSGKGRWFVWDKRCQIVPPRDQSDCEIAWASFATTDRIFYHVWDGFLKQSERDEPRQHPTQKPVALMVWCIEQCPHDGIIFDPFCGSGTTCVAAKMLGRRYIGIDISEEYCRIARERLRAVDTGVPVKEQRAGQLALFGEKQ